MDFGLHLQQEMPCSTEQCTRAQVSDVSSEAEIGKAFSPSMAAFKMQEKGKWIRDALAVILWVFFTLHAPKTQPSMKK